VEEQGGLEGKEGFLAEEEGGGRDDLLPPERVPGASPT